LLARFGVEQQRHLHHRAKAAGGDRAARGEVAEMTRCKTARRATNQCPSGAPLRLDFAGLTGPAAFCRQTLGKRGLHVWLRGHYSITPDK
jgi:hypothetical protein